MGNREEKLSKARELLEKFRKRKQIREDQLKVTDAGYDEILLPADICSSEQGQGSSSDVAENDPDNSED